MIYMFVDTLKKLMKERGLRACDLVDDDVTAQYISKLVNGKVKDPTWGKACAIIANLGMTVEEFYLIERTDDD